MASIIKRCYWRVANWPKERPIKRARRRHALAEARAAASRDIQSPTLHARAAADWICRAQDATADDGIAAEYCVGYNRWRSSFPETTGYIVPTLLEFAHLFERSQPDYTSKLINRLVRMADWLSQVQLPCGGIQSGFIDTLPATPTIFNTGQVIFGWLASLKIRDDATWQRSLEAACQWLCDVQDDDGCWRRHGSYFVETGAINTYNVRAAWALIAAAKLLNEPTFAQAGRANLDWALSQESSPGFFENNDFVDPAAPVLHTIAYTARGFLEAGLLLQHDEYITAASRIGAGVAGARRRDGSVSGRLTKDFQSGCRSSCLTGLAQIALVWGKLDLLGGEADFASHIDAASRYLRRLQSLDHPDPGVRGGIAGSQPIGGDYAPNAYPNWAAKFFLDLMITQICVADTLSDVRRCGTVEVSRSSPELVTR